MGQTDGQCGQYMLSLWEEQKSDFAAYEHKGSDQPKHLHSLIIHFVIYSLAKFANVSHNCIIFNIPKQKNLFIVINLKKYLTELLHSHWSVK